MTNLAKISRDVQLSVIIATYNNIEILKQCLNCWQRFASDQPIEILVIADGCRDGTEEFLAEQATTKWGKQFLRWFREDNVHELRCTNRGISEAKGKYVLSWHDDMFVQSDRLVPELLRTLDRCDEIGLISLSRGLLIHLAAPPQKWEDLIDWNRVESTIGKRFWNWFYLCEVDAVMRPWIIRKVCVEKVGCLDEEYKLSEWDEADLCFRIREAGWKVATYGYERLGYYYHLGSSTTGNLSDKYKAQVLANGQLFHARWFSVIDLYQSRTRKSWARKIRFRDFVTLSITALRFLRKAGR